jgi:hypothetical protein
MKGLADPVWTAIGVRSVLHCLRAVIALSIAIATWLAMALRWAVAPARHGAIPRIRVADKMLAGVTCIRLHASVVACHNDKEGADELQGPACYPLLA